MLFLEANPTILCGDVSRATTELGFRWTLYRECLLHNTLIALGIAAQLWIIYHTLFASSPYGAKVHEIFERCRGIKRRVALVVDALERAQAVTQVMPQPWFDDTVEQLWLSMYDMDFRRPRTNFILETAVAVNDIYRVAIWHFAFPREDVLMMVRTLEEAKAILEWLEEYSTSVRALDRTIFRLERVGLGSPGGSESGSSCASSVGDDDSVFSDVQFY